jgi:C4-dicarboxylate-binding protein DctP
VKKVLVLVGLIFLMAIAGCSGNGSVKESDTVSGGEKAGVENLIIKYATPVSENDYGGQGGFKFKEVLEDISGGKMQVQVFPAGQLGSMREHIEGAQVGSIDVACVVFSAFESFIPETAVLGLTFIYPENYDQLWPIVDEMTAKLQPYFEERGLVLLGISTNGFNQFTSNKPITCLGDFKKITMRVVPSPLLIKQYESWGASVSAIEFAELYLALQQGTVDAQENALMINKNQAYHEVSKYLTISNHSQSFQLLVANKNKMDNLSEKQRELFMEANKANIELQRSLVAKEEQGLIDFFKDYGVKVHYLSDEAKEELREASRPVYEMFAQENEKKQELFNTLEEAVQRLN